MAIRVNRNVATATACVVCSVRAVCASWTVLENTDGLGWRSAGTVTICPTCLREAADIAEVQVRRGDIEARLRAAGHSVPYNATLAELVERAEAVGITVPGAAPTAGTTAARTEALAAAAAAGVPLGPSADTMVTAEIQRRIAVWAEADALGVSLLDTFTTEEAAEVVSAATRARDEARQAALQAAQQPPEPRAPQTGTAQVPTEQPPAEQAAPPTSQPTGTGAGEVLALSVGSVVAWVQAGANAAEVHARAVEVAALERATASPRATLLRQVDAIVEQATGTAAPGDGAQQAPRGRTAPIEGSLV
ncbi:MAG: hypothetical protein WC211_01175 [Dehalococcoidia bacterium]